MKDVELKRPQYDIIAHSFEFIRKKTNIEFKIFFLPRHCCRCKNILKSNLLSTCTLKHIFKLNDVICNGDAKSDSHIKCSY